MTQEADRHADVPPAFADEREAGAFWDEHSPLDYPEHFQPVEVDVARRAIKRGLAGKPSDDLTEQLAEQRATDS